MSKNFVELVNPWGVADPVSKQRYAREQFPDLVADSNFRLWRPGDQIPSSGTRLLLGVATYSSLDMELLDALNKELDQVTSDRVDVFDVVDCVAPSDFESYVPGLKKVFQSPILGFWEDGELKEALAGKPARDFVINRYSLLG